MPTYRLNSPQMIEDREKKLTAQRSWITVLDRLKASAGVIFVGEHERDMRFASFRLDAIGRAGVRWRSRAGDTLFAVLFRPGQKRSNNETRITR